MLFLCFSFYYSFAFFSFHTSLFSYFLISLHVSISFLFFFTFRLFYISVCVCIPLFYLFSSRMCFYFCLFPLCVCVCVCFPLCDHAPRRFFSVRFFAPISKPYTHKWRFNSPSNNVAKNSRKKSTKDDRQGLGIIQTEKIYKHKDLK